MSQSPQIDVNRQWRLFNGALTLSSLDKLWWSWYFSSLKSSAALWDSFTFNHMSWKHLLVYHRANTGDTCTLVFMFSCAMGRFSLAKPLDWHVFAPRHGTWRKPTQIPDWKDQHQQLNPGPSCCEMTVLTTEPPCRSRVSVVFVWGGASLETWLITFVELNISEGS